MKKYFRDHTLGKIIPVEVVCDDRKHMCLSYDGLNFIVSDVRVLFDTLKEAEDFHAYCMGISSFWFDTCYNEKKVYEEWLEKKI